MHNLYPAMTLYYKQDFMRKKIIITILAAMAVIAQAVAQGAIGSMKIHPVFGNQITRIIDTGSMIYYLSDNTLYSYDKDNDESDSYSRSNRLNGSLVRNIYYNYDRNYLAVAYEDANIDLLTDDGATINLPDIYNADMQTERTINDITFADGRMLVATNFGIVVFNDRRYEVEFSRILNTSVSSVAATTDYLWINADNLYYCDLDTPPQTLAEMTATSLHEDAKLVPCNDGNTVIFAGGWTYRVSIDNNRQYNIGLIRSEGMAQIQPTPNGYIATTSSHNRLLYLDNQGSVTATYTLPAETAKQAIFASMENEGQVWELSTAGLRHIQLDQSGGITILSDYYHPNASSVRIPVNLTFNSSTGTLLVSCSGPTLTAQYNTRPASINILENGTWTNVLPDDIPVTNPESGGLLRNYNIYHPIFNPDNSGYFFGSLYEGAYQVRWQDGEIIKYDTSNSPMVKAPVYDTQNCVNIAFMQFDASGNLWMLQSGRNVPSPLIVLPHDKVQNSSVTESDWIDVNVSVTNITHNSCLYITRNDIKIVTEDQNNGNMHFIYDDGNPASSSIQSRTYRSGQIPDQDGAGFEWQYIYCFTEDLNGNLWLGTQKGPVYLNPKNIFSTNLSLTKPRIPRNDGTNYADNLLEGIPVSSIAVDGSNRKWIGTVGNGLYLVNEDGSEVLLHYTTDNSPLPSNTIYSICCATNSNSVFAGTDAGLVEIFSDASQPSADFNNVYAYPNPVRPEYTGTIAIVGLMDNSLVKITDSTGNVVRSLKSLGGTATWDGCNSAGKRVKTGVYFVLVSQSDGSSSSGTVATKILFVN